MRVLRSDKRYLCFHWIYILKWVIKEVPLQRTVSIKEHSRCLTTVATATKNINGKKKYNPHCSVSHIILTKSNYRRYWHNALLKMCPFQKLSFFSTATTNYLCVLINPKADPTQGALQTLSREVSLVTNSFLRCSSLRIHHPARHLGVLVFAGSGEFAAPHQTCWRAPSTHSQLFASVQ